MKGVADDHLALVREAALVAEHGHVAGQVTRVFVNQHSEEQLGPPAAKGHPGIHRHASGG